MDTRVADGQPVTHHVIPLLVRRRLRFREAGIEPVVSLLPHAWQRGMLRCEVHELQVTSHGSVTVKAVPKSDRRSQSYVGPPAAAASLVRWDASVGFLTERFGNCGAVLDVFFECDPRQAAADVVVSLDLVLDGKQPDVAGQGDPAGHSGRVSFWGR